jgi:hypothetical protein
MPQPIYNDNAHLRACESMNEVVYDFWKAGCDLADVHAALDDAIDSGPEFDT